MINISKKICVGQNSARTHKIEHGSITPVGTSHNEKNKLDKFTQSFSNIYEYDNTPLPGFTLHTLSASGTYLPRWSIIDPRGFMVDITSNNLMKILSTTGITEGLIQERCVWAREDSLTNMTLVPVSSELYTTAVANTDIIDKKVNIKDVQIGDTVLLQNNLQGKYLGVMSLYGAIQHVDKNGEQFAMSCPKRQVVEVEPDKYYYQTNVKILKIIKKTDTPLTKQQAVEYVNNSIATGTSYFSVTSRMMSAYYSSWGRIDHASLHATPKVLLKLVEIDSTEAQELYAASIGQGDFGRILFESTIGEKYTIKPSIARLSSNTANISVEKILLIGVDRISVDMRMRRYKNNAVYTPSTLTDFAKFYKIIKLVGSESYI